ncbi:MAG: aspartate--tRNA ligase, partial [Bacilli bacterium]|nr:aspartate--tRNA ligase [Bacilli bacterium]
MKPNIYRTNYCGLLTNNDIDKKVKLSGWVENIRDHGGVIFVDIRDYYGTIQVVSNDNSIFDGITKESSVRVSGKVRKRDKEDYNPKIATGEIEVLVDEITVLGKSLNALPFDIISSKSVSEDIRLKYRYLDLRNPKVKENIIFRNKIIDFLREKMKANDFLEIQTPILTASSPEGARDFLIPARKHQGKFYSLPQAPQQFKQLLMVSGFDKYFQIAPCFRDEDGRSDRIYGEFYQLDFEMCFAEEEDVYEIGEEIFYDTFKKFSDKVISPRPFKRISYDEAMLKYGTDKPDLRNPLEIIDLTDIFTDTEFKPFRSVTVRGIKVADIASNSNSWFNEVVDFATSIGMPGIGYLKVNEDMSFAGPIAKFLNEFETKELIERVNLKSDSVLFFIADRKQAGKLAGLVRDELGRKLNLIDNNKFEFCIINDFPLYKWDDELDKYDFMHNPFSMPKGG